MPDFTVKRADAGAARPCADIGARCFSEPWSEVSLRKAAADGSLFLVAKSGGHIIGYFLALHTLDEGQIVAVAVREDARRMGVGRRLTEAAIDEGRKMGISSFYLEVRRGNAAAISLYEKVGFVRDGIRPDFYTSPREDAILMSLKIREK